MNQKHERLQKLDAEMMRRGADRFQTVNAARDGKRYPVYVIKIADNCFSARITTRKGTKSLVLRSYDKTPSAAVLSVLKKLEVNLRTALASATRKYFPQMEVAR